MKDFKKTIMVATMFTLIAGGLHAQETATDSRSNAQFGLKAGINYSNVYDRQGEEFTPLAKLGFAGGAFLSIPFGDFIGFQPEILYSQKGFHATGRILGETYDFKRTTNYIDVPLFLSYKPIKFLSLLIGPQYSYSAKPEGCICHSKIKYCTREGVSK